MNEEIRNDVNVNNADAENENEANGMGVAAIAGVAAVGILAVAGGIAIVKTVGKKLGAFIVHQAEKKEARLKEKEAKANEEKEVLTGEVVDKDGNKVA